MLRRFGAVSEVRDGLQEDVMREEIALAFRRGTDRRVAPGGRPGRETGFVNRKVLIVDADRQAAQYHKRKLAGRFEAETAADPTEALERLARRGPFAAVVTELAVPGGGLELLRKVFEMSPHTARIVLTRQVTLEAALRAVNESRVFGFLEKSGDVAKLAQTLEEAVVEYNRLSRRRPRESGGVLTDEEISFLMGRR